MINSKELKEEILSILKYEQETIYLEEGDPVKCVCSDCYVDVVNNIYSLIMKLKENDRQF